MNYYRQRLQDNGIAHQKSHQEEVMVGNHWKNAASHLSLTLGLAFEHYLEVELTEGVETDSHAGTKTTSQSQNCINSDLHVAKRALYQNRG